MKVVSLLSVLLLGASFLKAQTINGVVLNNAGSPEPGVNVVIVGTFSGAFTDINGKFQLQSNSADSVSLRFSAIGYQTVSRRVLPSSQSSISVQLEPSLHQLDEVVLQASRANRSTATTYPEISVKIFLT